MPRLSCWFIRASLAYLVAGFTLGALMLTLKAVVRYEGVGLLMTPSKHPSPRPILWLDECGTPSSATMQRTGMGSGTIPRS